MQVVCAWCGIVLSEVKSGSGPISHGICASCSLTMERAFFKSRVLGQSNRPHSRRHRATGVTLPLPGFPVSSPV